MTIHRFPSMPIRNPSRELGLSEIPLPPRFALRDMERASGRFMCALSFVNRGGDGMPEAVRELAASDSARHASHVKYTVIDGVPLLDAEDLVAFVHYVTGHPKAWVLSWQVHAFAASMGGLALDRATAGPAISQHVAEAAEAFAAGFNREL